MNDAALVWDFTYHDNPDKRDSYQDIRNNALAFARVVNIICSDSKEKEQAILYIEQAVMWANAAIARDERERPAR